MTSRSAQEIAERALSLSRADGCLVLVEEATSVNTRWAANALTTNGLTRHRSLTVISTVGATGGVAAGVVSSSRVDDAAVADIVAESLAAARSNSPAEDALPLLSGTQAEDWHLPPGETGAGAFTQLAPRLGDAFTRTGTAGRELFGFAEHSVTTTYLATSTGLRLRHEQPTGRLDLTAKSHNRSRSTWIGVATRDFTDVDFATIESEIDRRLGWSDHTIELPPGKYDTILPPTAVADLMIYAYWSMSARDADEGRSVFSKKGGGTRVGDRLSSRRLTLASDPHQAGLQCAPFVTDTISSDVSSVFDAGLPLAATRWIDDGVLSALLQTRHSSALTGLPVTPGIDNLILTDLDGEGGIEDLITRTERGLLVTCLWYIRQVDPQTLLLTGLTRDGVHLVEGGEVVGTVPNFRFNEAPVAMLDRVAGSSTTGTCLPREWGDYFTRAAMPALLVDGFNMSSVSQAS